MTKQNKLFSWLGFGKKNTEQQAVASDNLTSASPLTETQGQDNAVVSDSKEQSAARTQMVSSEPALQLAESAGHQEVPESAVQPAEQLVATVKIMPEAAVTPLLDEMHTSAGQQDMDTVVSVSADTSDTLTTANSGLTTATPVSADIDTTNLADAVKKPGFFARLKQGLAKTSQNLGSGLASLFVGKKIDDELYEELETQLLLADVGMDTTQKLIKQLTTHADRKALKDADLLFDKLQQDMATLLQDVEQPLVPQSSDGPFVILMVGVNGVGKTTTIGKMAQQFRQQGKSVMLAAGDTFRAAAVEQLQVWGERNKIPVIAQHTGADSASVIFDAYQAAKARKVDILIADTAGRLQNKAHLMEELKKIVRVLQKIDAQAPHEVMLTLDAGTGQNALSQARLFNEAVPLTGISLTKLDGTAKGGVIFAIADQFKVPIRFIGVGEAIDDLRQFAARDFIRALFNKE